MQNQSGYKLSAWFGTKRSKVQIQSPRLFFEMSPSRPDPISKLAAIRFRMFLQERRVFWGGKALLYDREDGGQIAAE
jgi:hypothetical protein